MKQEALPIQGHGRKSQGKCHSNSTEFEGIIETQAEDPLPSGGGMNAVPTAIELEAKSISS
jgi:hypothetical protein